MKIFSAWRWKRALVAAFAWGAACAAPAVANSSVEFERTPHSGIQPQIVTGEDGTIHLVYFTGPAGGGDLFYVRQAGGRGDFSAPIQVNHQPGSAIATGTIRGAQLALGKGGRVHVVWNGGQGGRAEGHGGAPLLYARLNDAGSEFEPERDLIHGAGLDGGSAVAADRSGNVYIAWHAPRPGTTEGEMGRAVYLRRSTDEGRTFSAEQEVSPNWGACGCCGMHALADDSGGIEILYRAATDAIHRDEVLLASRDSGRSFHAERVGFWQTASCPMSSAWLGRATGARVVAAWETAGQVYFGKLSGGNWVSAPSSPPGTGERKHPVAAANRRGELLLVWTDGTGWQRGGDLVWQLYDRDGRPKGERGRRKGVPVWSFAGAYAKPDGNFVIVY